MAIQFEFLPAGYVDQHFQKDEAGRIVFFPWLAWGRGRMLPDQSSESDLKRLLKFHSSIGILGAIIVYPLLGVLWMLFAMILSTLWYHLRLRALISGLPFSEAKFKRLSFREKLSWYNKPFSKFTLWLVLVFSMFSLSAGVFGLLDSLDVIAPPPMSPRTKETPIIPILLILFFGATATLSAHRLARKYWLQARTQGDDGDW
ncbi:hypothetical protein Desti_4431 [Desulfomonile tiedjei DSM 6799]|uniref:Uncharacterized protein n=1 Tax=Desulfomonile tiedjei (strain ATCC 49306 / DSM 6799 / DCB-1) TaxID=706587 RepID=I4CBX2_DESTA|nr:hypothetical protein Desti_4431 [Desulfomonile tiedjei DSM 6799]